MRRIFLHARFGSIALAFAIASPLAHAAANCMVWHAHVRPAPEPTRVGPPPATGVTIRHPPPGMWSGGGMPTANPSEDELLRRRVQKTVHERDTEEFLRQVPQDPKAREAFLSKHGPSLLDEALRGGALGVVRQMLAWDPGALRSRTAAQRLFLLDSLAYTWTHVDESLMRGWPVSRPPPDADFEALFKLLLADDVRYEGRRQVALVQVAGLPVTPERLRVAGWLLDRGASIEGRPSALAKAVERRNTVLAYRMLADHRPSQEALDEALAYAQWREPVDLVERLLVAGAAIRQEPRRFPGYYFEPAQRASLALRFHGEREPLRLAIRYGADPNAQMSPVQSALQNAMHDHELMEGLLKLGADPNYRATNGDSSLGMAIRTPAYVARKPGEDRPLAQIDPATDPAHRAKSVALLLAYGADPNQPTREGTTALMATRAEDGAIIEALFAKGGRVVVPEGALKYHREFGTPLGPVSWSLQQHNGTLAAALLRRGARAEGDDCGALYYALVSGQGAAVRALLDGKPNLRFAEKHGRDWPVLLYAAWGGSVEAVRLLLDRKMSRLGDRAPFDPKGAAASVASALLGGMGGGTGGGENALMAAVMSDNVDVVKELLDRGIDVRQRTGLGLTARDFARHGPNADEIRRLLREKGL